MIKQSKAFFAKFLVNEAATHWDILEKVYSSSLSGQLDEDFSCVSAIKAFNFFAYELASKIGFEGAIRLIENLPSNALQAKFIELLRLNDDLDGIMLGSSTISSQHFEFFGDFTGRHQINEKVDIKFKFDKELESFNLKLNIMNKRKFNRPLIPLIIESKCCLSEKTRYFSWFGKKITNFILVTDLANFTDVIIKNIAQVSRYEQSSKLKIFISAVDVQVSIPQPTSVYPICNKQTTRLISKIGFKLAS